MRACSKTARAAVCCCPRPWYHLPRHSLRPPSPAFRHQVTHKGFQADLAEITGAAVTTRGIYVATKGGAWRGPCCVGRVAWPVLRRPPAQPLATARSRGLAAGSGFQLRALLSTCAKHRPSPPPPQASRRTGSASCIFTSRGPRRRWCATRRATSRRCGRSTVHEEPPALARLRAPRAPRVREEHQTPLVV